VTRSITTAGPETSDRVIRTLQHAGASWLVELAAPPANVLDSPMIDQLTSVFREAAGEPGLKAICLSGQGDHFSYGASIPEHRPGEVGAMLTRFNGLFAAIEEASVPVLAVVRGRCLGGGLELAAFCHRVFSTPDALLGQPEIALGVLAPVASALLPQRVGQRHADDLLITGRTIDGLTARGIGLVDELSDEPAAAAAAWIQTHLVPRSASS
jgi:cyclohexa-1,5-dienecarbonyl-CoA hydratase